MTTKFYIQIHKHIKFALICLSFQSTMNGSLSMKSSIESVYRNIIFQERFPRKFQAAEEYNGGGYFCDINQQIGWEL